MRTFLVLTAIVAVASGGSTRSNRGVVYNNLLQNPGYGALQAQLSQLGGHYASPAPAVGLNYASPVAQYGAPALGGGYAVGGGGGLGGGGLVSSPGPLALAAYPEQVSKSVYVFSAPPDPFDNIQPQVIKKFPQTKRKHYQVVFINAPNPPLPVQHTVELPSPPELKTQVYVLVKKPQKAPPLKVIPAKLPVHKPEVYFIRYQNQKHGHGGGPGGLVDLGPAPGPGYGGPIESQGPVGNYGAPVYEGHGGNEVGPGGYGAPIQEYGSPAPIAEYGAPSGDYGTPTADYGAPQGLVSEYASAGGEYGVPSGGGEYAGAGSPSSDYAGQLETTGGGDPSDTYSDYSRLNALYTYAPRFANKRMDSGKWRPITPSRHHSLQGI